LKHLIDQIRRILLAIFVASLLLMLPSCRYLRQQLKIGEYSLKSVREWARQDSIWVADSIRRVMAHKKASDDTLTDSLITIDDNKHPGNNPGTMYYIIIGSFTDHDNAKLAVRQYSSKGYKTTIISNTNSDGTKLELVSVKTFNVQDDARVFLKEFQVKFEPDAWIYYRK
jgi:hypothetical protein